MSRRLKTLRSRAPVEPEVRRLYNDTARAFRQQIAAPMGEVTRPIRAGSGSIELGELLRVDNPSDASLRLPPTTLNDIGESVTIWVQRGSAKVTLVAPGGATIDGSQSVELIEGTNFCTLTDRRTWSLLRGTLAILRIETIGTLANPGGLRQTIGSAAQPFAIAMGFHQAGDGGGGLFRWFDALPETDDGGIYIGVSGSTGGWVREADEGLINVRWYGAVGDDLGGSISEATQATYDTDGFNSAIETANDNSIFGKTIFIPRGFYRINASLDPITADRVGLWGEGRQVSRVHFQPSGAGPHTLFRFDKQNASPTTQIIAECSVKDLGITAAIPATNYRAVVQASPTRQFIVADNTNGTSDKTVEVQTGAGALAVSYTVGTKALLITLAAGGSTPQDIVDAINADATAKLYVSAGGAVGAAMTAAYGPAFIDNGSARNTKAAEVKVAFELVEISRFLMRDVSIVDFVGGATGSAPLMTGGSVGVRVSARELARFENVSIDTERPFVFMPGAGAPTLDMDTFVIDGNSVSNPEDSNGLAYYGHNALIDMIESNELDGSIPAGLNVYNCDFRNMNLSTGTHGIRWVDSGSSATSSSLTIRNVRTESAGDANAYSIYIDLTGSSGSFVLAVEDCWFDGGRRGIYSRDIRYMYIRNTILAQSGATAASEQLNLRGAPRGTLELSGVFSNDNGTIDLTNWIEFLRTHWGSTSAPLPSHAVFVYDHPTIPITIKDRLVMGAPIVLPGQSAQPASPAKGTLYLDTDDNKIWFYDGTEWRRALDVPAVGQWDDLAFPAQEISLPGAASDPNRDPTTALLLFDDARTEMIAGVAQMRHRYVAGSNIRPHVHVRPTADPAGTGDVRLLLEYKWYNATDPLPAAYSTDYGTYTLPDHVGGQPDHDMFSFTEINGSGKEKSSLLEWRFSRIGGDAADTYVGDMVLVGFDIHFLGNELGSDDEIP